MPTTSKPNILSIYEFLKLIPDEKAAEKYLVNRRWKFGRVCPHCHSDSTSEVKNAKLKRLSSYMLNLSPIGREAAKRYALDEADDLLGADSNHAGLHELLRAVKELQGTRGDDLAEVRAEVDGLVRLVEPAVVSGDLRSANDTGRSRGCQRACPRFRDDDLVQEEDLLSRRPQDARRADPLEPWAERHGDEPAQVHDDGRRNAADHRHVGQPDRKSVV